MNIRYSVVALCVVVFLAPAALRAAEDLQVFSTYRGNPPAWMRWTDAENMLYHHLRRQAVDRLQRRDAAVAKLQSADDWRARQRKVRSRLRKLVGPLPERTPLNPRTTGTVMRDHCRIEKVIYESLPDFYVTACLFLPRGIQEPRPAVVYTSGHTAKAFRAPTYQKTILNLVRKGFVVLAYDPIGQGERLQYPDPDGGGSIVGGPTNEHSYVGAQCLLSGNTLARYWVWSGMRAIDYLETRSEVDADRIGVTGRSGGGTFTAYIGAFDRRVKAAAPECYLTSFRRLWDSCGPQDAEQNIPRMIAMGLDHPDLLLARLPSPTLMINTTRDFFPIDGATDTYREVQRAYCAVGRADNLHRAVDDAPHASTEKNREAMYGFFQRHLDRSEPSHEVDVEPLSREKLTVTETGQVLTSAGGETVFSINRSETRPLLQHLRESRQNLPVHLEQVEKSARELSGYHPPDGRPSALFTGRFHRDGYVVEKYVLEGEGRTVTPALLMLPEGGEPHPAVLYVHPDGKAAHAKPGGRIEKLVKEGYAVLAPDLLGRGELGGGEFSGDSMIDGINYNIWFGAALLGRSLAGIRAGQVARCARYVEGRRDIDGGNIVAVGHGTTCPAVLHSAVFEDSLGGAALIDPLATYRSLVVNRRYEPRYMPTAVPAGLTAYDLPDLAAALADRRLLLLNPRGEQGKKLPLQQVKSSYSVAVGAYGRLDARDALAVKKCADEAVWQKLRGWLPPK